MTPALPQLVVTSAVPSLHSSWCCCKTFLTAFHTFCPHAQASFSRRGRSGSACPRTSRLLSFPFRPFSSRRPVGRESAAARAQCICACPPYAGDPSACPCTRHRPAVVRRVVQSSRVPPPGERSPLQAELSNRGPLDRIQTASSVIASRFNLATMANSPPHPNTAADSPLDDPPLPTATPECDVGATYPPGLARGKQDGRAPPHDLLLGDDASKIEEEKEEEERGLLRDGAELDHRDERSRPGGGLDILRGRDWRQLWRENRRVILVRCSLAPSPSPRAPWRHREEWARPLTPPSASWGGFADPDLLYRGHRVRTGRLDLRQVPQSFFTPQRFSIFLSFPASSC